METIKCTTVGAAGKNAEEVLIRYKTGSYPEDAKPSVFVNHLANLMVNGKKVSLALRDTPTNEGHRHFRAVRYSNADIFVLFYSVGSPTSLSDIQHKWVPEVLHHVPSAVLLLVGTHLELRTQDHGLGRRLVSRSDPLKVAISVGAFGPCMNALQRREKG